MKKIHIILSSLLLLMAGCNSDDFLDKLPKDQLSVLTTFSSNSDYAWGFYNTFPGYNDVTPFFQETASDLMVDNRGVLGNDLLWQRKTIPSSSSLWNGPYERIRRVNLMLDNIDNGELTDSEKNHWTSVGYFFRAYEYMHLLKDFGAVPWVDKVLTDADEDILYGPRTPRDEVAQNILNDLQWAVVHINPDGNGANTINTDVVRALLSRFGLIEGTWRKYHGLGGEQQYLQASVAASTALIAAHPELHPNYDEVFNSESLAGVKGILLYKEYEFGILTGVYANVNRSSIGSKDLTKKAVDMYLCTDGQTIYTSPLFDGEKDAYDEFRNRDYRLYYNTVPPFRVYTGGKNQETWEYDPNPKYREYIDLMATLSDDKHKTLPTMNWRGLIVRTSPHFRRYNEGHGYNVTYSGYAFHKYFNKLSRLQRQDWNDAPIFRMGEVLLNHAEAMFELGQFDQTVADQTINKLRARGNVAPLDIANIVADPTRDADVDPVLWEIRRERAVEYLGEGFGRIYDIKRWKKLVEYGAKEKVGRWIKTSDYGNRIPVVGGGTEGYVKIFGVPPGVPEYYYLEPIPSDQIVLNPQIVQNPGWK